MLRILKISGDSLQPELESGDFVVISKIPIRLGRLTKGDLVAFNQPGLGLLVKQVAEVEAGGQAVVLLGTRPESVDSRTFGAVPRERLVGKVIYRVRR